MNYNCEDCIKHSTCKYIDYFKEVASKVKEIDSEKIVGITCVYHKYEWEYDTLRYEIEDLKRNGFKVERERE